MGRHIILIGIGQSGCLAADLFSHKMNKNGISVSALGIDTDQRTLSTLQHAYAVPMVDSRSLDSVVETLGAENIQSWFPCVWDKDDTEFVRHLEMNLGANQWRMKALLAFASFLIKSKSVEDLHSAIDKAIEDEDEEKDIELYYVASLAGGTGSGLFLPVSLYLKKYIESKELKIKSSKAMLLMPDIYENGFTAEQKIKSYANAYAALREYNAVLNCTLMNNSEAKGEKHPPVSFRIGEENGAIDLLFDTERAEYQTPSANPFDNVYLFERVPNVMSVDTHIEILSDVVISMCNRIDAQKDNEKVILKSPDAVFGGVSLIKVKYPIDSIVEYISKKQLNDCVAAEMGHVHKAVMAELERRRGEARLYGFVFLEDVDQYCDAYVYVCEEIVGESGTNLSLINRDPKVFENDQTPEDIWKVDYLAQLTQLANESCECESAHTLHSIIYPPKVKKDEKSKKQRKEKEKKKKLSQKQLLMKAQECGELMQDYYRNGIRSIVGGKQEFIDSLIPEEAQEDRFSLLNNILFKDGEYLHPVLALLRLSLVYKELSTYCKKVGTEAYDASDIDNLKIPTRITKTDIIYGSKTAYGRLGEDRFRKLALSEGMSAKKVADDDSLFYEDLEQVYSNLRKKLRAYRYMQVLETLDDIIGKYRRFVNIMWKMNDDIADEMKLALRSNSINNGNVVNVGASVAEKNTAYREYFETYRKNYDAIADYTRLLGKSVYAVLRKHNSDDSVRGAVLDVLENAGNLFAQQCRNSEYYRNRLVKNIYVAIDDSISRKDTGLTLSKVFKGRNSSVRIKMPEKFSEYSAVKNTTVAIFDKGIEKYLGESVIRDGQCSAKEHIERMMYDAGEYCGEADFAEYVADREMLLQTDTENLRLYFVNTVNELDEEKIGYKCYLNALERSANLNTQMWNPHLVYTRGEALQLPFINPVMQEKYERMVAESVAYALWAGELKVEVLEDGAEVYAVRREDGYEPLCKGEAYITADSPEEMMLWAYKNQSWVTENALKFENMLSEELAYVPAQKDGLNNKSSVDRVISSSELMDLLKREVLDLLFALYKNENAADYGFGLRLSQIATDSVLKFCRKAYKYDFDANYVALFNKQIADWISDFTERQGEAVAESLVKRLNSEGYIKPLQLVD